MAAVAAVAAIVAATAVVAQLAHVVTTHVVEATATTLVQRAADVTHTVPHHRRVLLTTFQKLKAAVVGERPVQGGSRDRSMRRVIMVRLRRSLPLCAEQIRQIRQITQVRQIA